MSILQSQSVRFFYLVVVGYALMGVGYTVEGSPVFCAIALLLAAIPLFFAGRIVLSAKGKPAVDHDVAPAAPLVTCRLSDVAEDEHSDPHPEPSPTSRWLLVNLTTSPRGKLIVHSPFGDEVYASIDAYRMDVFDAHGKRTAFYTIEQDVSPSHGVFVFLSALARYHARRVMVMGDRSTTTEAQLARMRLAEQDTRAIAVAAEDVPDVAAPSGVSYNLN